MKKIFLTICFLFFLLGSGKIFAQNSAVGKNAGTSQLAPSVSSVSSDAATANPAVAGEAPKDNAAINDSKKSCCKKGNNAGKSCCASKNEANKECGHSQPDKTEGKKEIKETGAAVN